MVFIRLLSSEMIKVLYSKQLWFTTALFVLVPFLFAMNISTNNPNVEASGLDHYSLFAFAMLGMFKELLLVFIVAIIFTATSYGKEIEDGIIKMTLVRLPYKWGLYAAKYIVNTLVVLFFIVSNLIASFLAYSVFMSREAAGSSHDGSIGELALMVMATLLGICFVVGVTMLLSLYIGFVGSLIGGLCIIIVFKFLDQVEAVRRFLPIYLTDSTQYYENGVLSDAFYRAVVLLPIYSLILVLLGLYLFMRKDTTR